MKNYSKEFTFGTLEFYFKVNKRPRQRGDALYFYPIIYIATKSTDKDSYHTVTQINSKY